ncbi:hypothetical protein H4W31_005687 [Plantactinospora soyae]|uniref:Uncharacterized protein n=1 Tax=Plantactinospora soyae TaxID=1544732 RepID=A0A927R832_9ACTN|nr:hypothetical protein [Plantactinospora soyae]
MPTSESYAALVVDRATTPRLTGMHGVPKQ